MYVRDLMTRGAVSIRPTDTLGIAKRQLQHHGIHHLVVLDRERLVGVLSYRDLISRDDAETVEDVMSRDVVVLDPHDTLRRAASMLLGRTHGCATVLMDGRVAGVLTTMDLMRAVSSQACSAPSPS